MEQHWAEVRFVLETLVWRIWEYDNDGMELYFTNQETTASVRPGRKQSVDIFVKALDEARPTSPCGIKTTLRPKLSEIMAKYYNYKGPAGTRKRQTVLILTDGIWEKQAYDVDVDTWMTETICQLAGKNPKTIKPTEPGPNKEKAWQTAFEESRQVTFQFIAFGHDTKGLERMKRLDDLLVKQGLP